eukprot:m.81812 g.81812  ORF g.81812 m.81812 type:complete len:208 (+) comp14581_c0_seq2:53-676(+)
MVDVVISYERQTIKTQMKPNLDLLELCDVLSLDKGQASKLKVVHKGQIVVQGQQLVNRAKLFVFASKGTIAPEWQHSFWNYLELLLSPLQALWQWLNGLWQARPLDSRAIVAATRYQAVAGSEQMIEIEVGHDFASTHQRPAILVTWKAVDCGQLVEAGVRQYLGSGPHRVSQTILANGRAGHVSCRFEPNDGSAPDDFTFWFDECG